MTQVPKIYLKKGKETAVLRKHPWIFSGAIDSISEICKDGDFVVVYNKSGNFLGMGFYSTGSIAVRLVSFEPIPADSGFWVSKIAEAYELRKKLLLTSNADTNAYRLIHGEGDGLPGLIVDIYNRTAVIQAHSMGMYLSRNFIAEALRAVLKDKLSAIFDKSSETLSKSAMLSQQNQFLFGNETDTQILEGTIKYKINIPEGQKTGFFIDQRDNRLLLSQFCEGKTVLNTFCYTGGFSLAALKGNASKVFSVDSSKNAIEMTRENLLLNNYNPEEHLCFDLETLTYFKNHNQNYDVVVLDPPAFAKHLSAKHNAVQGYKRLNYEALKKINKGGFLFTFSCSQVIDKKLFADTITAAAIESGRYIKIIHSLTQAPDHPVSIFHPEGEYLKGLVLYVE